MIDRVKARLDEMQEQLTPTINQSGAQLKASIRGQERPTISFEDWYLATDSISRELKQGLRKLAGGVDLRGTDMPANHVQSFIDCDVRTVADALGMSISQLRLLPKVRLSDVGSLLAMLRRRGNLPRSATRSMLLQREYAYLPLIEAGMMIRRKQRPRRKTTRKGTSSAGE